jgi:murein DD-endopeptidase MepM/ murein hydrolase activator NlpD
MRTLLLVLAMLSASACCAVAGKAPLSHTPAAAPLLPCEAALSLSAPAEVAPGQAFLVTLEVSEPWHEVQVEFVGRSFPAWTEEPNLLRALVAADADDEPGLYPLLFRGLDDSGARLEARSLITLAETDFGEQHLTLPPKMVSPDAPSLERIAADRQLLAQRLANRAPERLWSAGFSLPVPGPLLSPFGVRRVLNGEPRSRHNGVDLRAAEGEPVVAAGAGRVLLVAPFYFEGNLIVLDHGLGLVTIYCHLSQTSVTEGESVAQGQVIGLAGQSGRATGPHLHFGARLGGVRIDPLSLLTLTEDTP